MVGNSGAPQSSGLSAEAQTFIESGEFAEELDYDQIQLHLHNNTAIQDAAMDLAATLADTQSWLDEHESYRELLGEIYGNPDITQADLTHVPEGDGSPMGPNRRHATTLMNERDRFLNDFNAVNERALARYDEEVEQELQAVRSAFRDLASQLNGPHPDAVGRRRRIAEVDAAMEAIRAKLEEYQSQLARLRMGAMNLDAQEIGDGLNEAATGFDEWVADNPNPMIRAWGTESGPMRYYASGNGLQIGTWGTVQSVAAMEGHAAQMVESYVNSLPNRYPEVYQIYNSVMGGHHVPTWSETWWNIASIAAWVIGVEILGRVASLALAPITAGASTVVINAAIHVQRTRVLGGAVRALSSSRSASAVIRAGGRGLAAAQWLVNLPDRIIDIVVRRFDIVARQVLGLAARVRPTTSTGLTATGTATTATYTCCTLTSR